METVEIRMARSDAEVKKRRHQAHLAHLMAGSLMLMAYQSEDCLPGHESQTKLAMALSDAQEAALALARALGDE